MRVPVTCTSLSSSSSSSSASASAAMAGMPEIEAAQKMAATDARTKPRQ
jgi:hypothetical protein